LSDYEGYDRTPYSPSEAALYGDLGDALAHGVNSEALVAHLAERMVRSEGMSEGEAREAVADLLAGIAKSLSAVEARRLKRERKRSHEVSR
jgi:hypothetical protein